MASSTSVLFGMTTLGGDAIKATSAISFSYDFHLIDASVYVEVFDKYLLGTSEIASVLQINGSNNILRAKLGDMLRDVLGRQPRKFELEAWFTCLDYDRSAILDRDEYLQSTANLIEFSSSPESRKSTSSYKEWQDAWTAGRRVGYSLQKTNSRPTTAGQEIGWGALKPMPKDQPYHGCSSTDVTQKEGRNKATYYGFS